MPRRELPEVNAGSMADIAFTLLIFFLVSTTLATDKGERVKLPKWNPDAQNEGVEVTDRNVLAIDVLEDGSLAVEGNNFAYNKLEEETVKFLMNNGRNPEYSDNYEQAVINIRTHPEAPYEGYLEAYSNVKAAFDRIRDDYAMKKYGKPYEKFTDKEAAAAEDVRETYKLKIAEKVMDEKDMGK